jgi:hypothetical protein
MNTVEKIKCPNCGTEVDVNMALSQKIEERLKAEYAAQKEKEYTNRLQTETEKYGKKLPKNPKKG